MKKTLFSLLLLAFTGCSRFGTISKKIDPYNRAQKPFITDHRMRMMLYKGGYLDFIQMESDTIILNQYVQIESLIYQGGIWGNKGKVCYTYNKPEKKLEINKYGCELNSLIQKWDTLSIRKKELEQKNLVRSKVYYKRIILKNKNIVKKDSIEFMEIVQ